MRSRPHPFRRKSSAGRCGARRRAAIGLALATSGCTSYGVAIESAQPEPTAKSVLSVSVLVGSRADLDPPDPAETVFLDLLSTSRQPKYLAFLQFVPAPDPGKKLEWQQVRTAGSNPSQVGVDLAPLEVEVDSKVVESSPDLALLVVVIRRDGALEHELVRHEELIASESIITFDLDGRSLKRR